jgi:hypothetical protein
LISAQAKDPAGRKGFDSRMVALLHHAKGEGIVSS